MNNRGSDRQDIFSGDQDRLLFETLFTDVTDRFGVELHAYALMSNHFHLLWHDEVAGLSAAMQYLSAKYATAYNRRTKRDGPLLTGRFHSTPILDDTQLRVTARYIHRNPLAFVPRSALAAYRWSSLGAVLGRRRAPDWLTTGTVRPPSESAADHFRFVVTDQPSDGAVGSDGRIRALEFEDIIGAVADITGVVRGEVTTSRAGAFSAARTLAITVALDERVTGSTDLATELGLDPQSIRRIARQGRVARDGDAEFAHLHRSVLRRLREMETGRAAVAA